MDKSFLSGLHIQIPDQCLVRQSDLTTMEVPSDAPTKPQATLHSALDGILNTADSRLLLNGLNELLGGAANYAIAGSTALALHGAYNNTPLNRQPNDLDLVLSKNGMESLSHRTAGDLASLGMTCKAGNTTHLTWNSVSGKIFKIDIIPANNTTAGAGFGSAQEIGEQKVLSRQSLLQNLQRREQQGVAEPRHLQDLEFMNKNFPNRAET